MRSTRISGWPQLFVVVLVLLHSTLAVSTIAFPHLPPSSSPASKMERRADLQLPVTTTSAPSPTTPTLPTPTNASTIATLVPTLLPENEPVPSRRVFPYTPMTGANNSLYLTPNVTSREGLVEIKIGLLLPYSLPNNLTQQLTYRYAEKLRLQERFS